MAPGTHKEHLLIYRQNTHTYLQMLCSKCCSVVEHLSGMFEAVGSTHKTTKTQNAAKFLQNIQTNLQTYIPVMFLKVAIIKTSLNSNESLLQFLCDPMRGERRKGLEHLLTFQAECVKSNVAI